MTIHPGKSSEYASVKAEAVAGYIASYSGVIDGIISENYERLSECNKSQLNAIAAELETVSKRLNYILFGKY